ncbi:MAG: hypothetical protein HY717_16460 [Planctomycetes bacterium]|nr:hypothetical protein [Planctomycetota bacterium]
MSTSITIHFPKQIFQRLKRQSQVLEKPIDEIVVETVSQGLPLWLEKIPEKCEREMAQILKLDNLQLQRIAGAKLPKSKQSKLDKLLLKNSQGSLSLKELEDLDDLQLEANFMTLKKAQALALLRSRGIDLHRLRFKAAQ